MIPLVAMIISGCCFLAFTGWFFWPHPSKADVPKEASGASPDKKFFKHSLEDLFKTDFAEYGNIQGVFSLHAQNTTNGYDANFEVPFRVYPDFTGHSTFVAMYIPNQSDVRFDAFATVEGLRDQVQPTLDSIRSSIGLATSGPGIPYQQMKDLTFSGRVFIYTMAMFDVVQLGNLTTFYRQKNLFLEIRGSDYWWANKDR